MKKRIISVVLVAALLFGIVPLSNIFEGLKSLSVAQAAEEGQSLLQMLQINDSPVNTGDSTSNPYGPGSMNMFSRMELLYYDNVHNSDSNYYRRIYDYDENHKSKIWENQEWSSQPSRQFAASQSAAFDPFGSGKRQYVATIGYNEFTNSSSKKGLKYKLLIEDRYGNVLASTDLNEIYDSFNEDDYYLPDGYEINAFLAITAGDFDGDGKEEVAVYNPTAKVYGCAVEIYSFNNDSVSRSKRLYLRNTNYDGDFPVRVVCNWPVVQLTSGDINNDFADELVITSCFPHARWGNTKNTDYAMPVTSIVAFKENSSGEVKGQFEHAWDYTEFDSGDTSGKTQISCYGAAAIGDIDGDNRKEIVYAGYDLGSDMRNSDSSSIYKYNANVGVIEYSSGEYVKGAGGVCQSVKINPNITAGLYESQCQSPIALACFNPVGTGGKDYILIGGSIYSFRTDGGSNTPIALSHNHPAANYGFKLELELSDKNGIYSQSFTETYGNSYQYHSNIWIESVVTGNFLNDENAGEQLIMIVGRKQSDANNYRHDLVQVATDAKDNLYSVREKINNACGTSFKRNMSYTAIDIDDDGMILQFVDKEAYFSDPNIIAILQSAPYFEDLTLYNDDYEEDGETVFGKSSGTGSSETHGFDVTASVIAGYEAEASFFGISLGGVDFEAKVSASVGGEFENASEKTVSVEYASPSSEDRVILSMTPYIRYLYKMWTPEFTVPTKEEYDATCKSLSGDKEALEKYKRSVKGSQEAYGWGATVPAGWSDYVMCIPEKPRTSMITVTDFDKIAEATGEFEPIRGNVLNHEIGDPSSYPHSESALRDFSGGTDVVSEEAQMDDSSYIWVSKGGGTITQTIETTESSSSSVTWGAGVETELVTKTAGGVKVGAGVSAEYTGSYTTMNYKSTFIAGTVCGLPKVENNETAGFDFKWRFGSWKEKLNNQDCLVLGFVTKECKMPLRAPKNLSIKDSTSDSITLNWSKAGGEWTQIFMITDNEISPYFKIDTIDSDLTEYTVKGLSPNTKYSFALRATDTIGSEASVYTASVSGKTKYADGVEVPYVSQVSDVHALSGSDAEFRVTATPVGKGKLTYQWQEQVLNNDVYVWQNLKNEINPTLAILDVGTSENGKRFRCEVGQLLNGEVAYVYSNTASLYVGKGGTSTKLAISMPSYGGASGTYQKATVNKSTTVVELTATVGADGYSVAKLTDGNYMLTAKNPSESTVYQYIANASATADIEAAIANGQDTVSIDAANLSEIEIYYEFATQDGTSIGIDAAAGFTDVSEDDILAGNNTFTISETISIEDPENPDVPKTETVNTTVEYTKTYTDGTKTVYLVPVKEVTEEKDGEGNVINTIETSYDTYYYIDSADASMTEPVEVSAQAMGYADVADHSKTFSMKAEIAAITVNKEISNTVYTTVTVPGDPVTLVSLVESLSVGINQTPTGTVCFKILMNGDSKSEIKIEKKISYAGTNQASATATWTPSKAGTYTIVATYYGDSALLSSTSESKTYDAYEVKGEGTQEVKSFIMDCGDTVINNTSISLAPALKVTTVTSSATEIESAVTTPHSLENSDEVNYNVRMEYSEAPEGSYKIEKNVFTATVNGTYLITANYTDGEGADAQNFTYTKKIDVVSTAGEQQPIYFRNSSMTVYTTQKTVKNELSNFNAGATVRYKSTDESVATVDDTGVVTILKSGITSIVAVSSVAGKEDVEASYLLYINKQPLTLSVPEGITVTYGQSKEEALAIIKAAGVVVKTNGGVTDSISYSDITGKANDVPSYSINYQEGSGVGRYSVTIDEVSSVLYEVTNIGGYFEVVHKEISNNDIKSVDVQTKNYDGTTDATLSATFKDGVIVGKDVVVAEVEGKFDTSAAGENKLVSYQITGLSGANSGNYKLAAGTAGTSKGTIAKAPITVTAPKTTAVVYDGEIKSVNVLAYSNGIYYNDYTVKYIDEKGVETEDPVNVGKYRVVVELTDPDNFTIKNTYDSTLVIKSATQDVFTIEGIPDSVTYGDKFELQTAGAQEGGKITYAVSGVDANGNSVNNAKLLTENGKTYIEITGMGTVTVKATSTLANYNDKTAMRTFTVGKRTLAVKATPVSKIYDGTNEVTVTVTLDGLLPGDEGITATAKGVVATPDAGKAKTVFISDIVLSDGSKYKPAITSTQANVDIEKRTVTGFEITAEDKVYDKTTAANATVTAVNGVLDADKEYVTVIGSAQFDTKDRGENKTVTFTATGLSGDKSGNYVLADNAKTATCTASIVAASPKDFYISGHYSDVTVSEQFKLRAFYANEVTDVEWSSSDESVATVNAQTGEVTVVGAGDAVIYAAIDEGYGLDPAQFPLHAVKKIIQLYSTPDELIKAYNGRVQIPEILSPDEDFVPTADNVILTFVCESGEDTDFADPINAGKYKVYYDIVDNEFTGSGYLDMVINKGTIVVKASDIEKTYGEAPVYAYEITTGADIERATEEVDAVVGYISDGEPATAPAGEYDINITFKTAENDNIRFFADETAGKLTVNPAPLTLSVKDVQREYGFENTDPEYEYSGFVNGEDASVLSGELKFKYDSSVTKESPIGEYEDVITVDTLATSGNYAITVAYADGEGADLSIVKVSVETMTDPLDGITEENVNSDDEQTIKDVIEELGGFTPENEEEQKQLDEALDKCNKLLEKINSTREALEKIDTDASILDFDRATAFWEDDIKAFIDEINALLATDNLSPSEIAKLGEYKAQAEKLIGIINNPVKYVSLRFFYLIWDCLLWKYGIISEFFADVINSILKGY